MLTLYTAVGQYRLRKRLDGVSYPVVLLGKKELHLDPHEMLLWSSLAFSILTHQETKALFYEREKELHILSDLNFEHYLKRLIFRGLVASGTDYTGINALYRLLDPLYIRYMRVSPLAKLAAMANLMLFKHIPLKSVLQIYNSETLTQEEQRLLYRQNLKNSPVHQLLKPEQLSHKKYQTLTVLANLYFKKQIIFDTL